ncbi:hypothetical protein [Gaetbulibacter saemankumensis]|uniref:hypothetical protein n=1 Tax=Gaetbulibacter saemankumensis TaxID=311208 RepID=UPI000481473F|nr:hypothetical protein [Gaetbulibacter saemankumensis]
MRNSKNSLGKAVLKVLYMGIAMSLLLVQSCRQNKKEKQSEVPVAEPNPVIEIVTENMEFQAPDTIPSGWNTWRYINKSVQPHFILIDHPVDSITVKEFEEELLPPFGEGITKLYEGKNEEAFAAFGKIPEWFGGTEWPGGVGLISPGHTAETTLKLDPGYYIIECYVKMSNGMFHTNMGMFKPLIVSEEPSTLKEPVGDIAVDISSEQGIVFNPPTKAGTYVFSVNYIDQIKHEHFQGHDVNLVKIDEPADMDSLEVWMNWLELKGLIDPAPKGFTFLGGVNDMPAGNKGYFKITLTPGKYALISEVPKPASKNMLKIFEITE